jgi:replicative DNA helicase
VVAGSTSTGKSVLIDQLIDACARAGGKCALFCLEMSVESRVKRWLARHKNIPLKQLEAAYISRAAREELSNDIDGLSLGDGSVWIDDSRGVSSLDIRTRLRNRQTSSGLDLVAIDYLQLMSPARRGRSREEEVAQMSTDISRIAGDMNVPIILASQLNRTFEHERRAPELRDLRESGRIEQDADVVMMIHRGSDKADNRRVVYVRKNRNGPLGTVSLVLEGHYARMVEKGNEPF